MYDILPGIWDTSVITLRYGATQAPNPFEIAKRSSEKACTGRFIAYTL